MREERKRKEDKRIREGWMPFDLMEQVDRNKEAGIAKACGPNLKKQCVAIAI